MKKTLPKLLLTLGIAGAVLLMAGCEQKQSSAQGLLSDTEVSTLESLYGHKQDAVLEGFGLSENDVKESENLLGCWDVSTSREIAGKAFDRLLMYDITHDENVLYGQCFIFSDLEGTKQDEMIQLAVSLIEEAQQQYGEPSTYPGIDNRLTADGAADAIKSGEMTSAYEEWNVGENTLLTISIQIAENAQAETGTGSYVQAEYRINTRDGDEWDAIVKEAANE